MGICLYKPMPKRNDGAIDVIEAAIDKGFHFPLAERDGRAMTEENVRIVDGKRKWVGLSDDDVKDEPDLYNGVDAGSLIGQGGHEIDVIDIQGGDRAVWALEHPDHEGVRVGRRRH